MSPDTLFLVYAFAGIIGGALIGWAIVSSF